MNADKLRTAFRLAEAHARIDDDVKQVYLLESSDEDEDDRNEPIKLLEVVEGTLEVGIEPIGFPADPERGRGYRTLIVEVSPREFDAIGDTVTFQDKVWHVRQSLLPQAVEA